MSLIIIIIIIIILIIMSYKVHGKSVTLYGADTWTLGRRQAKEILATVKDFWWWESRKEILRILKCPTKHC